MNQSVLISYSTVNCFHCLHVNTLFHCFHHQLSNESSSAFSGFSSDATSCSIYHTLMISVPPRAWTSTESKLKHFNSSRCLHWNQNVTFSCSLQLQLLSLFQVFKIVRLWACLINTSTPLSALNLNVCQHLLLNCHSASFTILTFSTSNCQLRAHLFFSSENYAFCLFFPSF